MESKIIIIVTDDGNPAAAIMINRGDTLEATEIIETERDNFNDEEIYMYKFFENYISEKLEEANIEHVMMDYKEI